MSSKYALEVKNVSKSFRLPTEQASGIKQAVINRFKGIKGYKEQKVLENISFKVEKGDFFGIVGRNGSGKSTLLKLISQIYVPNSGEIKVAGKLVPFIELGVGFNPELTGRENVYMNGALLGFSTNEVDEMYDEIVDFAELPDFMDQKLKNYSSGMQVRLAFSIAIKAQGDILVLDEVLAVGDEAFQRKCYNYFAQLKKEKKTVILVTHSMDSVQQFCTKAMMIEKGEILVNGSPAKVAQKYRELFLNDNLKDSDKVASKSKGKFENKYAKAEVKNKIDYDKKLASFEIKVEPKQDFKDAIITFEIIRDDSESVYRWTTDEKVKEELEFKSGKKIELKLDLENIFPNGVFTAQVGIKKQDRSKEYMYLPEATVFEIINRGSYAGDIRWKPKENYKINARAK